MDAAAGPGAGPLLPCNSLFPLFVPGTDPTRVLAELDKGLRSPRVSDQCEALFFFERLVREHSQPIIIHTAFLKLVEVFRLSNNFIRYCIFQVFKRCATHFSADGVNADQLLKRLTSVLHSNDPLARAITLRTLGCLAVMVRERLDVHHRVRECLEATQVFEAEAAIYAADHLSTISPLFCKGFLSDLEMKILDVQTDPAKKLKLIRVLRHMHHTSELAKDARSLGVRLMKAFPTSTFVITILDTLSCLARRACVDFQEQMDLLCRTLHEDPRKAVHMQCLQNMERLARDRAQVDRVWLETLHDILSASPHAPLRRLALKALLTMSRTNPAAVLSYEEIVTRCEMLVVDPDASLADLAVEVLVQLLVVRQEQTASLSHRLVVALGTVLTGRLRCTTPPNPSGIYRSVCRLLLFYPEHAHLFNDTVVSLLPHVRSSDAFSLSHCVSMYIGQCPQSLNVKCVWETLHQALRSGDAQLSTALCILLLRANHGTVNEERPLTEELRDLLSKDFVQVHSWDAYKIGREAMTLGFMDLGATIFHHLSTQVESEIVQRWLCSIEAIGRAESLVGHTAICLGLRQAITHLEAARHGDPLFLFQRGFLHLRVSFLESCSSLRALLVEVPGGEVVFDEALLESFGKRTTRRALDISEQFSALAKRYENLRREQFNIDDTSTLVLEAFQVACILVAHATEALLASNFSGGVLPPSRLPTTPATLFMLLGIRDDGKLENTTTSLHMMCRKLFRALEDVLGHGLEGIHWNERGACIGDLLDSLLSVPLNLPPFFFRHATPTRIQLSLAPTSTKGTEIPSLVVGTSLVLGISGTLSAFRPRGRQRLHAVSLCISTQMKRRSAREELERRAVGKEDTHSSSKVCARVGSTVKATSIHDGTFFTSCLLRFPLQGVYSISGDASLIDQQGVVWGVECRCTELTARVV